MSTRSFIAVEAEGVDAVSCFYDGYPQGPYGVGAVLLKNYPDAPRVRELINQGNVTCLGPVIGSKADPDHYLRNHGYIEQSLFYARDWELSLSENAPVRFATRSDFVAYLGDTDARFAYLYTLEAGWLVGTCVVQQRDGMDDTDGQLPPGRLEVGTMAIEYTKGDILAADVDALVNPVKLRRHDGKGPGPAVQAGLPGQLRRIRGGVPPRGGQTREDVHVRDWQRRPAPHTKLPNEASLERQQPNRGHRSGAQGAGMGWSQPRAYAPWHSPLSVAG